MCSGHASCVCVSPAQEGDQACICEVTTVDLMVECEVNMLGRILYINVKGNALEWVHGDK